MAISPEKSLLADKTTARIVGPDGKAATYLTDVLSPEDAKLLRTYKKFLNRHGYKEALYCSRCWEQNLSHGCEAHVTDTDIGIRCRCRFTYFKGQTF